jgi:hypothetical protein
MRNERSWIVAGLSLAAAMTTFTGCQTEPKDGRSASLAADDKHITKSVKESLDSEPVYKFTDVDVKTFAGTVQLSGFVMTQGQKNRAQDIAQHTQGAKEVVNGITLKPAMAGPTVAPVVSSTSRPNTETTIYETTTSSSTTTNSSNQPSQTTEPK